MSAHNSSPTSQNSPPSRQQQQRDYQSQLYVAQLADGTSNCSAQPSSSSSRPSSRPPIPTRASTVGTPGELDRKDLKSSYDTTPHAKSEDLNHSGSLTSASTSPAGSPLPPSNTLSRPITPNGSRSGASSSNHSENGLSAKPTSSVTSLATTVPSICASCSQPLEGAFVRALGNVWHLQCFKCKDCDVVVASKFFPIDGSDGKQQPLCERDYFRRLNLICVKCGQALRGSYITACNKKYHVEHFTCSICPTVFGPQDSYYEHGSDVYCHFHYSIRFATKCAGCNSAILKQFVEINRNNRDECWHPECYMINKFWNVKISSRRMTSPDASAIDVNEPIWKEEEERESPQSLKSKQERMEQQVYRIWTVLSAFEESSAACISDMLRQVSNGQYLEAIRMAEKFILHVEVLFATIDDLEAYFVSLNLKGMPHVREARLLCRKTVDLFTLLSRPQDNSQRRTGVTQELLSLVTGLAHYLKILIRIALTGGLKLERDHGMRDAMESFLDKLHLLAIEDGNPSARRIIRGGAGDVAAGSGGENFRLEKRGAPGTQGVTYGFKSLAPENSGESPFSPNSDGAGPSTERLSANPPSDLCVECNSTVEEDCVRLGTYQRWHSPCLRCRTCKKAAGLPVVKESKDSGSDKENPAGPKVSSSRRPPANVDIFVYEAESAKDTSYGPAPTVILCLDHQHPGCRGGFEAVSRLEQYAFLLNVALRRLSYLLKRRGLLLPPQQVPNVPPLPNGLSEQNSYRDSSEIMRMKTSVHLDRKLSATARLPKRSTVVESPTGKTAHPANVLQAQQQMIQLQQHQQHLQQHHQQRINSPSPSSLAQVPSSAAVSVRSPRLPPQTLSSSTLQQPQTPSSQSPQTTFQQPQPSRPRPGAPGSLSLNTSDDKGQSLRPSFARNNTGVMIVDDSMPNSPAPLPEDPLMNGQDDGISLADIPQLLEAEEARKQHRPLPFQTSRPLIAELAPLELMIVKHSALLALYRSPLKNDLDMDDLLEFLEVKKGGFWNKLFKPGKQKKGVFGVPLEILVEREGTDSLLGASRAPLRVPSFIDDVICAMRQMDMSVEGIFRKNGNIRRLNDLTDAIDRDPSSVDLTQDNPVQLAALLKKFLKALPEPLMTYKLYKLFMAAENLPNEADRMRCVHLVTLLLPKGNRDTAEVLFVFLKWVASFSHVDEETGNKMDLHNLATVISPNVFRSGPSKGNDSVRVESFEGIRVMDTLLEHQDQFYTVPEEFLPLLRDQEYFSNFADLPSREFIKRCESYYRSKANGRGLGAGAVPPSSMASPIQGSLPFSMGNNVNNGSVSQFGREGTSGAGAGGFVGSGNIGDSRLNAQRSDSALSRGRQQQQVVENGAATARGNGFERVYPSAPSSLERGAQGSSPIEGPSPQQMQTPPPSSSRSGYSSRQQSPPPRLQHQSFSHPPSSAGPGMGVPILSQPRPIVGGSGQQDPEWLGSPGSLQQQQQRMQVQMSASPPSMRPGSAPMSNPYGGSEEGDIQLQSQQSYATQSGHQNGYNGQYVPSIQVRQRT